MVNSEFESKVLDFMLRSEKFMGAEAEFRTTTQKDISDIKSNVSDLCGRMTNVETDSQIKKHTNYIRIIGGAQAVIALIVGVFQYLKHN